VTNGYGFVIESLVAILLLATIVYCMILNRRLKRLRADERMLKATIGELITATEIAERAVSGLKATAHECDQTLGERLRGAERCSEELGRRLKAADFLVKRLTRILAASEPGFSATELELALAELPTQAVADPQSPFDVIPVAANAPVSAATPAARSAMPDPRNVAAAAQAFAERARTRLNSLAA
jgi:hypothetical protein